MPIRKEELGFVFDPSLVLYLPLWKRDGASFMSDDKHGHLATVTGALWTPRGRSFDGNSKIDCGSSTAFDTTSEITIDGWIKRSVTATYKTIVEKGDINASILNYLLQVNDGYLRFDFYNAAWRTQQDASTLIALDTWTHFAVVYDSITCKMYLNANQIYSNPVTVAMLTNTKKLHIGAGAEGAGYRWVGDIGEIRVYNRALNPLEIQRNRLATKWRYR